MKRRGSRDFTVVVCYVVACRASFELTMVAFSIWTVCVFASVVLLVPAVAFLWLVNRRIWRDLHHPKTLY